MMHLEGFRQHSPDHGPCPACLVNYITRRPPNAAMSPNRCDVTCLRCLRLKPRLKTYPVTMNGKTVRVTIPPREDEPGWRGRCPDCGEPTHANVCEEVRSRNAEIKKLRAALGQIKTIRADEVGWESAYMRSLAIASAALGKEA